jgi:hypothetical protein
MGWTLSSPTAGVQLLPSSLRLPSARSRSPYRHPAHDSRRKPARRAPGDCCGAWTKHSGQTEGLSLAGCPSHIAVADECCAVCVQGQGTPAYVISKQRDLVQPIDLVHALLGGPRGWVFSHLTRPVLRIVGLVFIYGASPLISMLRKNLEENSRVDVSVVMRQQ